MIRNLDKDNGQLLASDSKVMTGTVNKLKMSSKTGKVDSVVFKLSKLARRASWIGSSAFSHKLGLRTFIDELV